MFLTHDTIFRSQNYSFLHVQFHFRGERQFLKEQCLFLQKECSHRLATRLSWNWLENSLLPKPARWAIICPHCCQTVTPAGRAGDRASNSPKDRAPSPTLFVTRACLVLFSSWVRKHWVESQTTATRGTVLYSLWITVLFKLWKQPIWTQQARLQIC